MCLYLQYKHNAREIEFNFVQNIPYCQYYTTCNALIASIYYTRLYLLCRLCNFYLLFRLYNPKILFFNGFFYFFVKIFWISGVKNYTHHIHPYQTPQLLPIDSGQFIKFSYWNKSRCEVR